MSSPERKYDVERLLRKLHNYKKEIKALGRAHRITLADYRLLYDRYLVLQERMHIVGRKDTYIYVLKTDENGCPLCGVVGGHYCPTEQVNQTVTYADGTE